MKTFEVKNLYTIDGYQDPDGYDIFDGYEVTETIDGYQQPNYVVVMSELQRLSEYITRLTERKNSIAQWDVSEKKTYKLSRINSELDHYNGLKTAVLTGDHVKKINVERRFDNRRVEGDIYQEAIDNAIK